MLTGSMCHLWPLAPDRWGAKHTFFITEHFSTGILQPLCATAVNKLRMRPACQVLVDWVCMCMCLCEEVYIYMSVSEWVGLISSAFEEKSFPRSYIYTKYDFGDIWEHSWCIVINFYIFLIIILFFFFRGVLGE